MLDEIRQNGKTVLSGEDGFSIPMFFNNLCGKKISGEKYRDYIRYIAFGEMGFQARRNHALPQWYTGNGLVK